MAEGQAEGYPLVLNGDGCKYGQRLQKEVTELAEEQKKSALAADLKRLADKVDRMTWTLAAAAVALASTTVTLIITNTIARVVAP